MRKRFLLASVLITTLGILLFTVLMTNVFYGNTENEANRQLKIYSNFFDAEQPFDEASASAFSERLNGARVTYLDPLGNILADSAGEALAGESREDRPEVIAAFAEGEGYSSRKSATLGQSMFYYCVRLDEPVSVGGTPTEGCYLRIGIAASSEAGVFLETLPSLIFFLLLDILCCLIFAWIATSALLRPVEDLTKSFAMGGAPVRSKYPELQPLAKMMNDMTDEIGEKVARVRRTAASKRSFSTAWNTASSFSAPRTTSSCSTRRRRACLAANRTSR